MVIAILIGILQWCIILALIPLLLLFLVLPILVMVFPQYGQYVFFLNFRRLPMTDYNNVSSNGVESIGRAFFVNGKAGRLGVWHILPAAKSMEYRANGSHPSDEDIEKSMKEDNYKIIFYVHGNSFDRTFSHRVQLYNLLAKQNYHIVAFDYRGYGDSEGSPTEKGIVADTHTVYDYVKSHAGKNTVIIWGHSMGTGVSSKVVMDLSLQGKPPFGLILESPFNNLHDAIVNHPLFLIFSWMNEWLVQTVIMKPLNSVGLIMESDKRIKKITCPILILHAADDEILPVKLGRMLYKSAQSANRIVEYKEFDASRQFGHKFILRAQELPGLVSDFFKKVETTPNLTG